MTIKILKKNIKEYKGIGNNLIKKIYKKIGINTKLNKLLIKNNYLNYLNLNINKYTFNNLLLKKIKISIDFYIKLKNYRGIRHFYKYPVRGQRTHTNAKTTKKLKK
jgi:small subunit ribosomal protein S13